MVDCALPPAEKLKKYYYHQWVKEYFTPDKTQASVCARQAASDTIGRVIFLFYCAKSTIWRRFHVIFRKQKLALFR
jgi:hypothetical protein